MVLWLLHKILKLYIIFSAKPLFLESRSLYLCLLLNLLNGFQNASLIYCLSNTFTHYMRWSPHRSRCLLFLIIHQPVYRSQDELRHETPPVFICCMHWICWWDEPSKRFLWTTTVPSLILLFSFLLSRFHLFCVVQWSCVHMIVINQVFFHLLMRVAELLTVMSGLERRAWPVPNKFLVWIWI